MAFWLRAIEVKHLLEEYDDESDLEEVREKVSAILLNDGDPAVRDIGEELREAKTECEFDSVLGDLYDFADDNRIWIGGEGDAVGVAKGVQEKKDEIKELYGERLWQRHWDHLTGVDRVRP